MKKVVAKTSRKSKLKSKLKSKPAAKTLKKSTANFPQNDTQKISGKKSGKAKNQVVLLGTRKGAFIFRSDSKRRHWNMSGPHFLGSIVYHMVLDPRDSKTLLVACKDGHLGPTIFRSTDFGKNWEESKKPPAFQKSEDKTNARVVDHTFWLTPGHSSEKEVWYAGTSPQGLFRSNDGGKTWSGVDGFNNHPDLTKWIGNNQDMTPDGGKMHSIIVDPRDARHIYLGMSSGGCLETTDGGNSWRRLNKGCERVFSDPDPDAGHDPHCIRMHPQNPDRLYMQNHCGIYMIDRPSDIWVRIGKTMPKSVGDIGFPMSVHPFDPDTAWVFPMDGSSVWPRVSPDGKPAVFKTSNAGKSWQRQDNGLPKNQAWLTVKRQAMCSDNGSPVGLYFGTTSGEVWASANEGGSWKCLAQHLPHIYSIEAAEV